MHAPTIATGAEIGAPYDQYLTTSATWTEPTRATRPASWDIGAYEYGASTLPAPTNLRVAPLIPNEHAET